MKIALIIVGICLIADAALMWGLCKAAGQADKYFDPVDPNKPW